MDKEGREILIGRAKSGSPISYSNFMQQLGYVDYDPTLLTDILEGIARFEKENNRPLLTAMAKYKDRDEWGPRFYTLAKQLGYVNEGEILDKAFASRMQMECRNF